MECSDGFTLDGFDQVELLKCGRFVTFFGLDRSSPLQEVFNLREGIIHTIGNSSKS
jgi:hypothetical protein